MCVIVYKPAKVSISERTVLDMWLSNPHGAGIAVIEPDETYIYKGYMVADELLMELETMQDRALVLHFRYATHGPTNEQYCHPFVLHDDHAIALEQVTATTNPVLFHNGILSGYGSSAESDTAEFCRTVLSKISVEEIPALLSNTNSKYALVHNGHVKLIGGFEKFKGLQVSNKYFDYERRQSLLQRRYFNDEPNCITGKIRLRAKH